MATVVGECLQLAGLHQGGGLGPPTPLPCGIIMINCQADISMRFCCQLCLPLFQELDESMVLATCTDMVVNSRYWAQLLRLLEVQRCREKQPVPDSKLSLEMSHAMFLNLFSHGLFPTPTPPLRQSAFQSVFHDNFTFCSMQFIKSSTGVTWPLWRDTFWDLFLDLLN